MDTKKDSGHTLLKKAIPPVLITLLILLLISALYGRRHVEAVALTPENGFLDLRDVDCTSQIYRIHNQWDYYPNALYDSEDFAAGVDQPPVLAGRDVCTDDVPFGTYRLRLLARPHEIYTICSFSLDYGTRVLVNGVETYAYGFVADSPEKAIPHGGYMTIPVPTGETGQVELIYQYSNFVHREGGFIPATYLSSPKNMEQYKAGNALVSVTLSGAMLLLACYFALAAAVQRQSSYALLAFCCVMVALRDNLFWGTYLLPPSASWHLTYRLYIVNICLTPMSFLLLLESLYGKQHLWVPVGYSLLLGVIILLSLLLDTSYGVLCTILAYGVSVPYLCYLLWEIVHHFHGSHLRHDFDYLPLIGLTVLLTALSAEALLAGHNDYATRFGFGASGMVIFILMSAIAVGLQAQKQAADLAESHSRSQMLEHMNTMNLDFLHQVAHELRTPLTVISGYAQLTQLQLASNHINAQTPENLTTIQREAQRLADMAARLLEYSYGKQTQLAFGTLAVSELLQRAQAICVPICLKNGNKVQIESIDATIYGCIEMLLQVFINLAVNANRHTQNGTITIGASETEDPHVVLFRVSDTGSGISADCVTHIFEKGYSADGGNGLGLYICSKAIEAHGGQIWIEQTGTEGTVFCFTVLRKERLQ